MKQLDKQKFIEAKAIGKNNTEAALQAGAKNRIAAHKAGYRLSKDTMVQKQIDKAIKKADIDLSDLIAVFTDAMKAEKIDRITGEISIDYSTRMRAADRLLDLSGITTRLKDKTSESHNITEQGSKEIQAAMKAGDTVELQRAVFRKAEE